ncbi:hypothetical protein RRG08_001896, partial [Elysia crispata]
MHLPVVIGTVPFRQAPSYRFTDSRFYRETQFASVNLLPVPPPYRETITPPPPFDDPPTYAESIGGAVNIYDEEDDEPPGSNMGDVTFTPMYRYVYNYRPPPAYHE